MRENLGKRKVGGFNTDLCKRKNVIFENDTIFLKVFIG